jgi:hypothetical protein
MATTPSQGDNNMTTTPTLQIQVFNMRTGEVVRTFNNRKTATKFCLVYNDLTHSNSYNTRTAKAGK